MARIEQKTDKAIRASTKSIKSLDGSLASAAIAARSFATAFGAGLLAGGLSSVPSVVREVASSVALIGDQAAKIGITTDALQQLQFQAEQNGSSASAVSDALEQFSRRIGEAAQGSGDLIKILQANNIALRDNAGNMRPLIDLLADYANLIQGASSDQDRLVLATDAFGRAGTDMVNVLRGGSAEMSAMAEDANRLGVVIGSDVVAAAQRLDDEFTLLTTQMSTSLKSAVLETIGLFNQLGPAVYDAGTQIANTLGAAEQLAKFRLTQKLNRDQFDQPFDTSAFGRTPERPPLRVIVPLKPSGGGGGKTEAQQLADRRQSLALRKAEQEINAQERRQLELLTASQDKVTRSIQASRDAAQGFASTFIDGIKNGDGVLNSLLASMDQLLSKLADLALNSAFDSLFGTGAKTLSSAATAEIGKGFAGLFAGGGRIGAGQWGIVGENGPEKIRGPAVIEPMRRGEMSGVGGVVINFAPVMAAGVSRAESQAALEQTYNRFRREVPALIASAQSRGSVRWR